MGVLFVASLLVDGAGVSSGEKEGVASSELVVVVVVVAALLLPGMWAVVSEMGGALVKEWEGREVPTAVVEVEGEELMLWATMEAVVAEIVVTAEVILAVVVVVVIVVGGVGVGWASAERLLRNSFSSFDSRVFSSLVVRSSSFVIVNSSLV